MGRLSLKGGLEFLVSSNFKSGFVKPKGGLAHFFSGMMGPMFEPMGMNSCMGYELPSMYDSIGYGLQHVYCEPTQFCAGYELPSTNDSWMYGVEHAYSEPSVSYLDSISPLINSWGSNIGGSTGIQEPVLNFEHVASLTDILGNNFGGSADIQDPVNFNYFATPEIDAFSTSIGMGEIKFDGIVIPKEEFSIHDSYLDQISPAIFSLRTKYMGDSSSIIEPTYKTDFSDLMPVVNDWNAHFVGDTSRFIEPVFSVNDEFSFLKPVVSKWNDIFIGDTSKLDSPLIPGLIDEIEPVIDVMSYRFIGDTSSIADSVRLGHDQFDYLKPLTAEMTFTFLGDTTKLASGIKDLSHNPVFDSDASSSLQSLADEWTMRYVGDSSGLAPELAVPDLSTDFRLHFGPETDPVSVDVPGLSMRDDSNYLHDRTQELESLNLGDFQPFNVNDLMGIHSNLDLDLLNIELFGLHTQLKAKGQQFGVDLNVNPSSERYLNLLYCGGLDKLKEFKQKIESLLDDDKIMQSIADNAKVFYVNDAILSNGIHFTPLPKKRYLGVYDTEDFSIEFPLYELRPDKTGFDKVFEIPESFISKVVIPHEMSHCETIQYVGAAEDILPFDTGNPIGSGYDEHIKHSIGSQILEVIADANVYHKLESSALSDFVRERNRNTVREFADVTPAYVAGLITQSPEIIDLDHVVKYAAEAKMLGSRKMERFFNRVFSDLGYGMIDDDNIFVPAVGRGEMLVSLIDDLSQVGSLNGYSVNEARSMFIDFAERLLLLHGVGNSYLDRMSDGVDHYYDVLKKKAILKRAPLSPPGLMSDYELRMMGAGDEN